MVRIQCVGYKREGLIGRIMRKIRRMFGIKKSWDFLHDGDVNSWMRQYVYVSDFMEERTVSNEKK